MIKEIHLVNVQSHVDSCLKLSKGINVIIGESDCGKTAITRAMDWLLFGGSNSGLLRHGEKEFSADVVLSNGKKIERVKSSKENIYRFDKEEYAAFRTSVPEEIADELKLDRTINYQSQHDPIFMLTQSAGKNGSMISEHAGLSVVDNSTKAAKKELKEIKNKIEFQKDEYEGTIELLKELKTKSGSISQIKKMVKQIEEADDRLYDLEKEKSELTAKNARLLLIKFIDTTEMDKMVNELSCRVEHYVCQSRLLSVKETLLTELKKSKVLLESEITINKLFQRYKQLSTNLKKAYHLEMELTRLISIRNEFKTEEDIQTMLKEVQNEIKGKTCPTCGQAM